MILLIGDHKNITIACTRTAISVMSFAKRKAAKATPLMAAGEAGVRTAFGGTNADLSYSNTSLAPPRGCEQETMVPSQGIKPNYHPRLCHF